MDFLTFKYQLLNQLRQQSMNRDEILRFFSVGERMTEEMIKAYLHSLKDAGVIRLEKGRYFCVASRPIPPFVVHSQESVIKRTHADVMLPSFAKLH